MANHLLRISVSFRKKIHVSVTCLSNRQEKANAGNVTQKIHPPLKQSTLIHTQTHTYRQSYINSLKKHVRHTLNKFFKSLKNLVITLVATVLSQSSSNLLRMFVMMISDRRWNMREIGSKRRSLGQIFEKSCKHLICHSFKPIFFKLAQNVCLDDIWKKFEHG